MKSAKAMLLVSVLIVGVVIFTGCSCSVNNSSSQQNVEEADGKFELANVEVDTFKGNNGYVMNFSGMIRNKTNKTIDRINMQGQVININGDAVGEIDMSSYDVESGQASKAKCHQSVYDSFDNLDCIKIKRVTTHDRTKGQNNNYENPVTYEYSNPITIYKKDITINKE